MNENAAPDSKPIFKLLPTNSSSINMMDDYFDPRLVIGIIQGTRDLKDYNDFNTENKMRVLKNMKTILADQKVDVTVERIAVHFENLVKTSQANIADFVILNDQYNNHRNSQAQKIKNKPMPTLTPGSGGGPSKREIEEQENRLKHEKSYKNSMTPFKVPNPNKPF